MNRFRSLQTACLAILISCGMTMATAHACDDLLQGQWCGSWYSCTNRHQGRLNATFCRLDACHVQAHFTGTFARVMPFCYRPVLKIVHEEPGLLVLQGSQRLPLMGDFSYQATVTGNTFTATYRSRKDHGHWQMSR